MPAPLTGSEDRKNSFKLSHTEFGIVLRRRRSFTDGLHDDGDSIRGIKRGESEDPQGSTYGVPAYKEV